MLILRTVGLLVAIAIALCVAAGILTGNARYYAWAKRLFKVGLAVVLVFLAVMLLERLIVV